MKLENVIQMESVRKKFREYFSLHTDVEFIFEIQLVEHWRFENLECQVN